MVLGQYGVGTPQIGVGVDETISENVINTLFVQETRNLYKKHEIKRVNPNSKRFM